MGEDLQIDYDVGFACIVVISEATEDEILMD